MRHNNGRALRAFADAAAAAAAAVCASVCLHHKACLIDATLGRSSWRRCT